LIIEEDIYQDLLTALIVAKKSIGSRFLAITYNGLALGEGGDFYHKC